MSEVEKTPEQIEAERVAAEIAQAKKDEAARKKAETQAKKDQEKADKKAAREAAAQAKKDEAAQKKAEREAMKLEKNGVTRPLSGATKQIWDIADKISADTREPATRALVMEQSKAAGLQEGTINTQYGRWRKFHGLTVERQVKPKAPAAPAGNETTGE